MGEQNCNCAEKLHVVIEQATRHMKNEPESASGAVITAFSNYHLDGEGSGYEIPFTFIHQMWT